MDEASSMVRTEIDSMPEDLDEMNRRILQLEIERVSLKKEDDLDSKERLESIEREISELKSEYDSRRLKWEEEKAPLTRLRR